MAQAERSTGELDVHALVHAEVFVVCQRDGRVELTGPCGAAPWLIEVARDEHPLEVVARMVRATIGPPILVHSTSWRSAPGGVILTFVVVIPGSLASAMDSEPVRRAELARSAATAAPTAIAHTQVVEHGMRHLAWLVLDDPVVAAELEDPWPGILAEYVPEPFRALG